MKITLSVILAFVMQSLFSQNQFEGKVVDRYSSEPLGFANIYLPQLEKGTISDEDGNFQMSNLPTGTFKVVVSLLGYETLSKNIVFPTTESISFELIPSAIEMKEVIVSTPFHKLQSENVMKVEREKVADLKAKGAVTLADGLTAIVGVENISTGMGIGKPVIRGLSSNRVLVYTQGVRLENQQFGDEHGLGINDAGIESVEVIKGPASLLYGSDALGGVLYLNPERFANDNSTEADLSGNYYTNTLGYATNAAVKSSGEQFRFLFRGTLVEHSDYETQSYRVTNTRFQEKDFKSGLGFQSSKFKTELRYNLNSSKLGIPEEIAEQSEAKTPLLPFQEINNHIMSSKSTYFLDNSNIELKIGLLYNDRKEFEEELDMPELHMKLKTLNYDLKYHLPTIGKFETIVGIQGMFQQNSNYGEEELIPDANTKDFGVMATSHIHFEKIDVQLGARFDTRSIALLDNVEKEYNSFNGALGFKTNLAKQITARLNLASGFRAPNLAELTSDGVHEGTNRYEIGNIDLNNEQNFQTDLSLEYTNEHIELSANGFYNAISDYIFLTPTGDLIEGEEAFQYVQSDAYLYGGEFGFHLHPHPLDWLHLESSFQTVIGKQSNEDYLPLIPANGVTNTLRVEFDTKSDSKTYAFIRVNSTFEQNKVSDFETSTDGYTLLSAGFGGVIKVFDNDLSINISGTNLTDKEYIHHLSRLKSDGILNMGRNISLGLTYNL